MIDWSRRAILNGTNALTLHRGTTAERPVVNAGSIRFNTETSAPEVNLPTGWADFLTTYSYIAMRQNGVKRITASYDIVLMDEVILAAASPITVRLPAADRFYRFTIKKIDSGSGVVTVSTRNAQTIDGAATFSIPTVNAAYGFVSDGFNWFIV